MKAKIFFALVCASSLIFVSCDDKSSPEPPATPEDTTCFNSSSIVGVWACIAHDNLTYDQFTGKTSYHWNYDPNAQKYKVYWYFNIQNDSKVQYVEVDGDPDYGEYRKSDKYLHIDANSKLSSVIDANYIFDEKAQAIRCPSGKIMGFYLESTKDFLGSDIIFYVRRYGLNEAVIYDNTGYIYSQYVVRVKGIKKDL